MPSTPEPAWNRADAPHRERWGVGYRVVLTAALVGLAAIEHPDTLPWMLGLFSINLGLFTAVWLRPLTAPGVRRAVSLPLDVAPIALWTSFAEDPGVIAMLFFPATVGWAVVHGARWANAAAVLSVVGWVAGLSARGEPFLRVATYAAVLAVGLGSVVAAVLVALQRVEASVRSHHAERLQRRLERTRHHETSARLAAAVAHDMNNTLTAILGLASLMRDDVQPGSAMAADLDALVRACRDGQNQVNNILGVSGRGVMQPAATDPAELLTNIGRMLDEVLPANVSVTVVPPRAAPRVNVDAAMLGRMLLNLGLNSAEASRGEAVAVTIEATAVRIEPDEDDQLTGGVWLRVDVADDGPGLPIPDPERAFDPLFSTKSYNQGAGLGLAMVRASAERHGGVVRLRSEPGVGTRVTLFFPASDDAEAHHPPQALGPAPILVVEDEAPLRRALLRQLHALGHPSIGVRTAREALDAVRGHEDGFALVVLDLGLPDADGRELIAELRRLDPTLQIVVSTGDPHPPTDLGAVAVLPKPYDFGALAAVIQGALGEAA